MRSIVLTLLAGVTLAAQTPDLSGTWVADSNGSEKWVLEQKQDKMHVRELSGDKVESEFTCSLDGQECAEKGHHEKIMMYFNGAKLVEIRERGNGSTKQRLAVSADGKTLTVETVPLSSDQKAETMMFHRQS